MDRSKEIIVAITGASGAAYGLRLIQRLAAAGLKQHLLFSDAARIVMTQETDLNLPDTAEKVPAALAKHLDIDPDRLRCYGPMDWFSPAASGSARISRMVIVPCSMGTLARIACGASDNLIERAADVVIKEKGSLILVPRETPLSAIHLENMLKLAQLGVALIPAMPGFYHRPECVDDIIDFIVDRVLDQLHIANPEAKRWSV